jgi:hypothetical protein
MYLSHLDKKNFAPIALIPGKKNLHINLYISKLMHVILFLKLIRSQKIFLLIYIIQNYHFGKLSGLLELFSLPNP